MTTEEKFNAAVNVIRSLPKNGSYQPSHEMMLRFYAYFKQATQGACEGSRPAFWDVVGRAKFDAWKKLGEMSKQDAMSAYVHELHTIVETMSFSDNVANFLEAAPSGLDNLRLEDLQLVVGDVIERVISQPNSPLASREASPSRLISSLSNSSRSTSPGRSQAVTNEESDGEYEDTFDTIEPRKTIANGLSAELTNGHINAHKSRPRTRTVNVDISQEIAAAVQSIQNDIERLAEKVNAVETQHKTQKALIKKLKASRGVSPTLWAFIIMWPIVVNFVFRRLANRCGRF